MQVVLLIIIYVLDGCSMWPNVENETARYFNGVEIQYENESQRDVIVQLLNDILSLPEQELRTRTYPDYAGHTGVWHLPEIIPRYFVPDDSQKTLGDHLYSELKTSQVQVKIRGLLATLTE